MKPYVMYLCALCADEIGSGNRLVKLPVTDKRREPKPCESCRKKRHGDLYYLKRGGVK